MKDISIYKHLVFAKLRSFLVVLLFISSSLTWACPPCPSGSTTSGTGASTNLPGCKCTTGTATWNGSACVEPSTGCSAVSRTWLTSCGASLPASTDTQVRVVTNSNVNYNGSATYTCNNGTWAAPTSTSCTIKTCSGGSRPWLTNCSANVATTNAGANTTVSNSAAGYTGSATFACNDGTWGTPTSTSCSAAVACNSTSGTHNYPSTAPSTKYCSGTSFDVRGVGSETSSSIEACRQTSFNVDCSEFLSYCASGSATCSSGAYDGGTVHDCGGDYSVEYDLAYFLTCN